MKLSKKTMLLMLMAATSGSLLGVKKHKTDEDMIARLEQLNLNDGSQPKDIPSSTAPKTSMSARVMALRKKIAKPSDLEKTAVMLAVAAKKKDDDMKRGMYPQHEFEIILNAKNLNDIEKLARLLQKTGGLQFLGSVDYRRNHKPGIEYFLGHKTASDPVADGIEELTNRINGVTVSELTGKIDTDALNWLQAKARANSGSNQ